MKSILFVINPVSGIGKQKNAESLINQHVDKNELTYEIVYTKAPKHATDICNENDGKYDIIAGMGGDGLINEMVQGMVNGKSVLAIIPCGSGNGMARHLGIPLVISKVLSNIATYRLNKVDLIKINDEICFNAAGVGFDAKIAHEFSNRSTTGFWGYFKCAIKEYNKYIPIKIKIEADDRKMKVTPFIFTIANSSQYGNNAIIAPNASVKDNFMDITMIKRINILNIIPLTIRLFTGTLKPKRSVMMFQSSYLRIFANQSLVAHIDGEPKILDKEVYVRMLPQAIKVLTP